jgi:endonuclease YncB( thermonuclease family)
VLRLRTMNGACITVPVALTAISASAETLAGRGVDVTDGDTIKLLTAGNVQHRIRVAGIGTCF